MDFLNSSPSLTRLLPYPRDTYFYPEGPTTTNRSRTKEIKEGRMNEERSSDFLFIYFYYEFLLPNQKLQKILVLY